MAINSTSVLRVVASCSASALVVASAGFGAVFAYHVGIQNGYLLAGLTVLFAVALELVKPLAIQACFSALASWQIVRGFSLGLLGLIAVAYSVTSELALTAASRGDLAAQRASEAFQAKANQDRYQRAQQELATLKPTRAVQELEALVAKTKGRDCGAENGTGRWICQQSPHAAELGRAKRRQELEAITTSADPVKVADPGSTALKTYLAALGVVVSVEIVAQWLNLVPVLALELGSALAVVLVTAFKEPAKEPAQAALPAAPNSQENIAGKILNHIKNHGGSLLSERGLAKALGVDRNAVRRTMHSLAACGRLAIDATKAGTMLKLVS
jgi:hypothetical protein